MKKDGDNYKNYEEKLLRICGSVIAFVAIFGGLVFDCRHADEGAVVIIASVIGGALVWAFTGTLANISDNLRRIAEKDKEKDKDNGHGDV